MTQFPIDVTVDRLVEFHELGEALGRQELGRFPSHTAADPVAEIILLQALQGQTGDQIRAWLHDQPEAVAYRETPPPPLVPPPLPFATFRGAFCIPDALPGIPYGDGKRIWTPAFGCYRDTKWQAHMLAALVRRGHTWIEIQISGSPYHGDYPEIPLDVPALVADLTMIRRAGLRSIVAFRDDVGTDCSYLQPAAAATQTLVDCVMGIYESNGVFAEPGTGRFTSATYAKVENVLQQQRELWPNAINAFHSTSQDNSSFGFGESDFWNRMAPFVDVYFLQQSGWNHTIADTADRASDFTERLNQGIRGWPKLKYGVVEFELTTSRTYRDWTESQGIDLMRAVFAACRVKPTGYMDGGDPSLLETP